MDLPIGSIAHNEQVYVEAGSYGLHIHVVSGRNRIKCETKIIEAMNHTWKPNIDKGYKVIQMCARCGIMRQKKTIKRCMAIVNHPPWSVYKYEYVWHYTDGEHPETTVRPDCSDKPTWRNGGASG